MEIPMEKSVLNRADSPCANMCTSLAGAWDAAGSRFDDFSSKDLHKQLQLGCLDR